MYTTQYKMNNPFESWKSMGSFASESQAIAAALNKKLKGALVVRVIDRKKQVIYSN
jgi:hypothetical protein